MTKETKLADIKFNALRTLGALMDRVGLAGQLGLQFNGSRKLYDVFGYKKVPTWQDFYAKYLRQDIAKRIVDFPADSTWSKGAQLAGSSKQWNKAWEAFAEEHDLWSLFAQVDKLVGIGHYAVILIGFDQGSAEDPVIPTPGLKVNFLQAYAEPNIKIVAWEQDTRSPRYGLPVMYELTAMDETSTLITGATTAITGAPLQAGAEGVRGKPLRVHHSRIVHIAEGALQGSIVGIPRLMPVLNRLEDLEKICGGSAEMFWLAGNRGLQIDVDKEMELSPDEAEALEDEIDEYQHSLRRTVRTRGVQINSIGKGSDVADPRGTFSVIIAMLSGATGIPQRVLMGAEAGQLASQQDRANWADIVAQRRANFAGPIVLKPFIKKLIEAGTLPKPKQIKVEWPSAFTLNPLEESQMFAQKARSVANFARQTQPGSMPILTPEECRMTIGFPAKPEEGTLLPPQIKPDATASQAENDSDEPEQTDEERRADEGEDDDSSS